MKNRNIINAVINSSHISLWDIVKLFYPVYMDKISLIYETILMFSNLFYKKGANYSLYDLPISKKHKYLRCIYQADILRNNNSFHLLIPHGI
jgi:hypothetical protein